MNEAHGMRGAAATMLVLMACGGAPAPTSTVGPPAVEPPVDPAAEPTTEPSSEIGDLPGATAYEGPFASFEDICGALEPPPSSTFEGARHERCRVTPVTALDDAGPFEAAASFTEGNDGMAYLALRTADGWFVPSVPDGEPFGGGLSHHTPASTHYALDRIRVESGALRVIVRRGSSSFMPGRGASGSSSIRSTHLRRCGLRDGVPVCGDDELVFSERCQIPLDGVERECTRTGADV